MGGIATNGHTSNGSGRSSDVNGRYNNQRYSIRGTSQVIVGGVPEMKNLFAYIERLASKPATVLIEGPTGTGKEAVAQALHYNGQRVHNPFVAVNCAGIPEALLESELFGYVKGAFTGAYTSRAGRFSVAGAGTIFLDEIGDMALPLQAKILRVLQEREITKLGSEVGEPIEARIIAATNKDLKEEVDRGTFREDLYYRLSAVPLRVPSLKERALDVPLIANYFVERFRSAYDVRITGLSPAAKNKLKEHCWPGNVRELENIIERAFVVKDSGKIDQEDICITAEEFRERLAATTSTANSLLNGR